MSTMCLLLSSRLSTVRPVPVRAPAPRAKLAFPARLAGARPPRAAYPTARSAAWITRLSEMLCQGRGWPAAASYPPDPVAPGTGDDQSQNPSSSAYALQAMLFGVFPLTTFGEIDTEELWRLNPLSSR
jgi:hypothetical protein